MFQWGERVMMGHNLYLMGASNMRVKKLLHTRMRVSNIDETIAFYRDVLGLELVERKTSPRGSHLAFLAVPNSEELIELCSFSASGPVKVQEDLVHLAFEVDNLDQTIAALNAKQVKITDGPTRTSSGSRFIFIDAPDGYEVELIERPPGTAMV
jgi:lactoylglutathione lyase